jgi:phosphomannomutase
MKEKDKRMNIIPMNIIKDKINYIKCKYQVSMSHVNKDDQIINYKDSDGNIINEEIEKEIKVIINGEIKSNRMKFKFEKEVEHIIYSVTDNNRTEILSTDSGSEISAYRKTCVSVKHQLDKL